MKLKSFVLTFVCGLLLSSVSSCSSHDNEEKESVNVPVVNNVQILPHPRLLFTSDDEARIRKLIETDEIAASMHKHIEKLANALLTQSLPNYRKDLLSVSRNYLCKCLTLGMAFRLSHDTRYVNKANEILLKVCNFPDWHKEHFLDTAEMTTAVSILYDWMYNELPNETKKLVEARIKSWALNYVLKEYKEGEDGSWAKRNTNWNVVCNSGMTIGALALADIYPDIAAEVVKNAVKYVPNCLKHFAPDGVCYEGPAYWEYTNIYLAILLKATRDNFKTDYGTSSLPGIDKTALYYVNTLSPSNKIFNFADAGNTDPILSPAFLMFGTLYNQPEVTEWYRSMIKNEFTKTPPSDRFYSLGLAWLQPKSNIAIPKKPKVQVYHGINDIITFNGSANVESSIFLIAKGADPDMPHQQMDGGTFTLETDGIRWADELGSESYSLPGFWDYKNRRWNYFLNTNLSHNTINIDSKNQNQYGTAHISKENLSDDQPSVQLDMTPLYSNQANEVLRTFKLLGDTSLQIHDQFSLKDASSTFVWSMVTKTNVSINGNKVTFEKDGKYMTLEVVSPANGQFSKRPAKVFTSYEKPEKIEGVTIVECNYKPGNRNSNNFVVQFTSGRN